MFTDAPFHHVDLRMVRDVYRAAFEHASETKHWNINFADSAKNRRLGLLCAQCNTCWTAPYPGPGQLHHWPHGMMSTTSEARRVYLADGLSAALSLQRKSVWDWIRKPAVDPHE